MAMFPPAPPNNFGICPGPTSDFFKREERAFFAQPGKEIVRLTGRVEVYFPHQNKPNVFQQRPASRPWPLNGPGPGPPPPTAPPHDPYHSLGQSSSAPLPYPYPATIPAPRVSIYVNTSQIFPPPASNPSSNNFKFKNTTRRYHAPKL
jgi:hypothetical protein